ncbi:MAG: hypothetical protein WCA98_13015 [Candidatus Acidiferrales bacterium]
MRATKLILATIVLWTLPQAQLVGSPESTAVTAPQSATPEQAAATPAAAPAPARDRHEGLTVSALPCVDVARGKEIFGKQNPIEAGILAIDVTLQNETAQAMRVTMSTIRLEVEPVGEDRQKLSPLTAGQVATLIVNPAGAPNVGQRRLPPGIPVVTKDKKAQKLTEVLRPFVLDVDVIPPLGRIHGYLFFNFAHQFDLVRDSTLYLPDVKLVAGNKPLMFFEVPLESGGGR